MINGPRAWALLAMAAAGCTRSATERPPGPMVSALFAVGADVGADADSITRAWMGLQDIALRVEKRHRHSHADVADDLQHHFQPRLPVM